MGVEQQLSVLPALRFVVEPAQEMATDDCDQARESCGQLFARMLPEKAPVAELYARLEKEEYALEMLLQVPVEDVQLLEEVAPITALQVPAADAAPAAASRARREWVTRILSCLARTRAGAYGVAAGRRRRSLRVQIPRQPGTG